MHKARRYTGYADSRRGRTIELPAFAWKPQKFLVWILLRLFYNSDSISAYTKLLYYIALLQGRHRVKLLLHCSAML